MPNVSWALVYRHSTSGALGFMVERGNAEFLVVQAAWVRIVKVIERDWVHDLLDRKFLDFVLCVKGKGDASELVLYGMVVNAVGHINKYYLNEKACLFTCSIIWK